MTLSERAVTERLRHFNDIIGCVGEAGQPCDGTAETPGSTGQDMRQTGDREAKTATVQEAFFC